MINPYARKLVLSWESVAGLYYIFFKNDPKRQIASVQILTLLFAA
jgi:hypothetical protein